MDLSPTQHLFNLHLHIKKSQVNTQRNIEEVKRLRLTFEKQIKDLISSLYSSSRAIWQFRYNAVGSIHKDQIQSADSAISTLDAANTIQRVLSYLQLSREKLSDIITRSADANDGHLSQSTFLLILSIFNFLWSQEQVTAFTAFIKDLAHDKRKCVYPCFLVQPLTQIYFENCLSSVFCQIQGKTTDELKDSLIENMKTYAPLFPEFLRELFKGEDKDDNRATFWEHFLKPFLTLSSVFGLTHPEFPLYCQEQFSPLLTELNVFFATDEASELIDYITNCGESLSILPSEALLVKVDPMYNTSTIVDTNSFESTEGMVDAPNVKSGIIYVNLTKVENPSQEVSGKSESLNDLFIDFLRLSRLVKLEREEEKLETYLKLLADFNSIDGNGDIELALDKLLDALPPEGMTLSEMCQSLENELTKVSDNDALMCLSEYGAQNLYLSKLKDVIESICKNALNCFEFTKSHQLLKVIFNDPQSPAPISPQIVRNPKMFVDYFQKCTEAVPARDPSAKATSFLSYRNLCSIILQELHILDLFNEREDLKKLDETVHNFINEEADNLLAFHQLKFLDIYREDRSRLKMFFEEFDIAFKCKQPFEKISHIHAAYQVLTGLLQLQGIGEIGADQIVPFAMVATVYSNPIGLASTSDFLTNYISPLLSLVSPLDHAEEYSVIQFLSTFQFVSEKMKEKGIDISVDNNKGAANATAAVSMSENKDAPSTPPEGPAEPVT